MKKNVKLEWYAMDYNWNKKEVEFINVLRSDLVERIQNGMKKKDYSIDKKIENLRDLKTVVQRELMYNYWSKAEYEITVGDLFPKTIEELEKISVYDQLEPNLDRIVEYINNAMELGLKCQDED